MSGVPLPMAGKDEEKYKSKCELYDGNAETSGLCSGWVTKTSHCIKRDDELGKTCDGFGKFPGD